MGISRHPAAGHLAFSLENPNILPLGLRRRRITHAIIAGGVTDILTCEKEKEATRSVNVTGVLELSRQLHEEGIKIITFSSDYVFDGRKGDYEENSPVHPLNEYGKQKAELEAGMSETFGAQCLLLRLGKIYDLEKGGGTLLDEMCGRLVRGRPVFAAADQVFCPTFVGDVVEVSFSLAAAGASGLINLCSPEKTSRLELARRAAGCFAEDTALAREILLRDLDEPFERPRDTSMATSRLAGYSDHSFMTLEKALCALREKYGG